MFCCFFYSISLSLSLILALPHRKTKEKKNKDTQNTNIGNESEISFGNIYIEYMKVVSMAAC